MAGPGADAGRSAVCGSAPAGRFPLSNCQHTQLPNAWVPAQFHPVSVAEHLSNGRPWDLERTVGGLMMLQPHHGTEREGWHAGTADALLRTAPLIRQHGPDTAGAER